MSQLMTKCKLCNGTGQEFHLTLITCRKCNGACKVVFDPKAEWDSIWSNYTKEERNIMLADIR